MKNEPTDLGTFAFQRDGHTFVTLYLPPGYGGMDILGFNDLHMTTDELHRAVGAVVVAVAGGSPLPAGARLTEAGVEPE